MEEKKIEKKEEKVEEIVKQEDFVNVIENVVEKTIEEKKKDSSLKMFEIYAKTSASSGKQYYMLTVHTYGDSTADLFLSATQIEVIKLTGIKECYVDIETRTSDKGKYNVIAFHVGEFTFDFFPKDRGFIPLAMIHANKFKATKVV